MIFAAAALIFASIWFFYSRRTHKPRYDPPPTSPGTSEAIAASMGIDFNPGTAGGSSSPPPPTPGTSAMAEARGALEKDALFAFQLQQLELESQQRQAMDHCLVTKVLNKLTDLAAQELHDSAVAHEIDDMSDEEWDDNGDLYERPFTRGQERHTYRVFFKGFSVSEGGNLVGGALGGAIMDFSGGNQLSQVKKYVAVPLGKNAAQYYAMIEVLEAASKLGGRKIIVYTDSKPLYNQIKGYWRVTTRVLQDLFNRVQNLLDNFESFELNLALHGENWPAENLARLASFSQRQTGASSSNFVLHCIICMEDVASENVFTVKACSHRFCSSCVKQHVELSVTSGYTFPVNCPIPECGKAFSDEECKPLLTPKALGVFMKKVEESRIPEAQRFYCPYPNCSELLDKRGFCDRNPRKRCRACDREFCVDCRVPWLSWHLYLLCSDFQRLPAELKDAEDAKLHRLAENQKWRQCKQCRRMIELSEGCYHMTCRCGYEFCYTCGAPYRNKLQTCVCKLWDEHYIIREEDEEEDEYESDPEEEDDEPRNTFYKTQLCRFFQTGNCRNGHACNFAHGAHELREEDEDESDPEEEDDRPRNTFYKTQLCRYFQTGNCRNGQACNFAHGAHELR